MAATLYYYSSLPDAASLANSRSNGSVTFLDMNDRTFHWRGEQHGDTVTVNDVAPSLINAIIAIEDKRYRWHFGISPRGIIGAIIINLREGRGAFEGHGGSTITQQVGKLICYNNPYDPERWESPSDYEKACRAINLWRKIKEVPFAMAMELKYTKDEILMIYMNRVYLGAGTIGFQAASQRYFDKNASELNLAESTLLAGLLTAPSKYTPTRNLSQALQRASLVATLMEDQGYISSAAAARVSTEPAQLSSAAKNRSGGHFVDWILQVAPDFVINEAQDDVVIQTTYDPRVQRSLEDAVDEVLTQRVYAGSGVEIAMITMTRDGAVRGMVGGKHVHRSGFFNRAVSARRQTGSLFKPIVFAAGMESGLAFDDLIDDSRIRVRHGDKVWEPNNDNNKYFGPVTLTEGLARSLNSVAVRVLLHAGRDMVAQTAKDLGVESELVEGPSIALGTSEATLLEMTGVYTGILNGGWAVHPHGIRQIKYRNESGPILRAGPGLRNRVLTGETSRQLVYMLSQVVEQGTGRRASLEGWEVGGKTGTTQKARDAWFIGFTADYVTGVWMGYDDNTPLTGVQGGGLPAELWRLSMERMHADRKPVKLPMIKP